MRHTWADLWATCVNISLAKYMYMYADPPDSAELCGALCDEPVGSSSPCATMAVAALPLGSLVLVATLLRLAEDATSGTTPMLALLRHGHSAVLSKRAVEVGPATVERTADGRYDWQDGRLRKRRRESTAGGDGERRLRPRDPGRGDGPPPP